MSDSPVLCDFSAASPAGYENVIPFDPPLPVNGPSPILCEGSDMFAMASLIFRMEGGIKAELYEEDGELVLPEIHSGNEGLDEVVRKAWLGRYNWTADMLSELRALHGSTEQESGSTTRSLPGLDENLQGQIDQWRSRRQTEFGCVLDGMLSEDEIEAIAKRHGLDMNADFRFAQYISANDEREAALVSGHTSSQRCFSKITKAAKKSYKTRPEQISSIETIFLCPSRPPELTPQPNHITGHLIQTQETQCISNRKSTGYPRNKENNSQCSGAKGYISRKLKMATLNVVMK